MGKSSVRLTVCLSVCVCVCVCLCVCSRCTVRWRVTSGGVERLTLCGTLRRLNSDRWWWRHWESASTRWGRTSSAVSSTTDVLWAASWNDQATGNNYRWTTLDDVGWLTVQLAYHVSRLQPVVLYRHDKPWSWKLWSICTPKGWPKKLCCHCVKASKYESGQQSKAVASQFSSLQGGASAPLPRPMDAVVWLLRVSVFLIEGWYTEIQLQHSVAGTSHSPVMWQFLSQTMITRFDLISIKFKITWKVVGQFSWHLRHGRILDQWGVD